MSNSDSLIIATLVFLRLCGFFVFSPFFSHKIIPLSIRIGAALACSLIVMPPLLPQISFSFPNSFSIALYSLKELAVGYLLGWILALILEAASVAGQLLGTLMGFSATELLDPLSTDKHPLLSRFFILLALTIFFALDLHHPLLRLILESYQTAPLSFPFSKNTVFSCINLNSLLFQNALEFAFFPLTFLLLLISIFALISRFMPIFWIGFPLQLIVGITTAAFSIKFFVSFLEYSFYHTLDVIRSLKIIVDY